MTRPLREVFADLLIRMNDAQLRRGDRQVRRATNNLGLMDRAADRVSGTLRSLTGMVAGAFGVGAMVQLARATAENVNEMIRWSQRLNISIVEMNSWSTVAGQFGVRTEDVADALKELQLKAQDALTGGTSQAEMFERIGISLDDLRPRVNNASELMEFFTERLERVNDEGLRNFTVDELMSDAGTRMLPVFRMGSVAIEEQRRRAQAYGERIEAIAGLQDKLNRASREGRRELQDMAVTIGIRLLPKIIEWIRRGSAIVSKMSEMTENSHILEAALISLSAVAGVFAISTIGIWGPIVLAAAGVVLLTLAIDDLYTAFTGGKSATERWLNSLGELFDSPALGTDFINSVREGWGRFFRALDNGANAGDALAAVLNDLWESGSGAERFAASVLAAILGVYAGISEFVRTAEAQFGAIDKFFVRLRRTVRWVQDEASSAFDSMSERVTGFSNTVLGVLQPAINILTTGFDALTSTAQRFMTIAEPVTRIAGNLMGAVSPTRTGRSAGSAAGQTVAGLPGVRHAIAGYNFLSGRDRAATRGVQQTTKTTSVDARINVGDINISEAADNQETRRVVREEFRVAQDRQTRQWQAASVES
jgi:hypothetical protein